MHPIAQLVLCLALACSVAACSGPGEAADEAVGIVEQDLAIHCGRGELCHSSDPCRVPQCILSHCVLKPAPDGTSCSDHNACTTKDTCHAGACVGGAAVLCRRASQCYESSCDPAVGCVALPVTGKPCDDGNACTTSSICVAGNCSSGAPLACPDAPKCQVGSCDPVKGCVTTPMADGTPCDDGNACTTSSCVAGNCISGAPLACPDAPQCQVGSCDRVKGCVTTPIADATPCDDGDPCTTHEACSAGACGGGVHIPGCSPSPITILGCSVDNGHDTCQSPATNPHYNPCVLQHCDTELHGCVSSTAVPDGTVCDDRLPGPRTGSQGACTSSTLAVPGTSACTVDSDCPANHACVANFCVCNSGTGVNCNDACENGVCTTDTYTSCPCVDAGDLSCVAGQTCCGQLTGGCTNLGGSDPTHCGTCSTDCNTYYRPMPTVGCTNDLQCSSQASGSCELTIVPGPIACTQDADCKNQDGSPGKCNSNGTAGPGNPGVCYRGSCRYLTQPGNCSDGACTNRLACDAPTLSELESATQNGVSALDFDNAGGVCSAWVTNYRTDLPPAAACGAACGNDAECAPDRCAGGFCCAEGTACVGGVCQPASIQKIAPGGAVSYSAGAPGDFGRLNGISVLPSGALALASIVDDGTGASGMGYAAASSWFDLLASQATSGVAPDPFDAQVFDTGPVGPRIDKMISGPVGWTAYLANFLRGPCADMEICKVTNMSISQVLWCNQPCSAPLGVCSPAPWCTDAPERITALDIAPLKYSPPNVFHKFLIVGHGTTLSFLDLDLGKPAQRDFDLTNPNLYDPTTPAAVARGESTPTKILSIAAIPFGNVVIEVRGSGDAPNRVLLNVDPHDFSVRNERLVQRDVLAFHPCIGASNFCPSAYACVDGACLPICVDSCPFHSTCTNVGPTGTCESPSVGTQNVCCPDNAVPANLGATDGRLTITPDGQLLRFVPSAANQPATGWAEYWLTK